MGCRRAKVRFLACSFWLVDNYHFVHSKVMAWVAFDRAADAVEAEASGDSAQRWREIADEIHAEICERGFDAELDSFVQ